METMSLRVNKRIESVLGSSTLAITAKAKELKAQGKDVINFAGGEPDFDTPETIKQAAIKAMEMGKTKYTPSIGTLELRQAICDKFQKDNHLSYNPTQVVVSCGAKHSVFNIIQILTDEGDEVIIPTPYWVSYPEMVKMAGSRSLFIPTTASSDYKITADQLSAAITDRSRILILNSPSNPTGMVYTKEELEKLAEICVKHNIYVISDEIYEKLVFDGKDYTSIASLGADICDLTITINGVSKAYAMTGWRIGYAAGNEEIMGWVKKYQDHSTSCPSSISQAAAFQALKEPEEVTQSMCAKFQERRDLIMSLMDQIEQLKYIKPQGAFYLFCDFSVLGKSAEVAKRIIEEINVAIIPGEGFGAPGYMRLSFATSNESIQEGVKRIHQWIKQQ